MAQDGVGVSMNSSGIQNSDNIWRQKRINNNCKEKKIEKVFEEATWDATFKLLFAHEGHKNHTKSLLNALLFGGNTIQDLSILNPENIVSSKKSFKTSVDIICTDQKGKQFMIEMQRQKTNYFLPRCQYYMAKKIVQDMDYGIKKSDKYQNIDTIYMLVIVKNSLFQKDKRYERTIEPRDIDTYEEMPGNKMVWKFIELNKFLPFRNKIDNKLKDDWLDFLADCHQKTSIPKNIDENIRNCYELMKEANLRNCYELMKEANLRKNTIVMDSIAAERDYEITEKNKAQKAKEQGMRIGEIKGEIDKMKIFKKHEILYDIQKDFKYLKSPHINRIMAEEDLYDMSNTQIFEEFQKSSQPIEEEHNPYPENMGIGRGFVQSNNQYNNFLNFDNEKEIRNIRKDYPKNICAFFPKKSSKIEIEKK